jgi:single-strand DNA-binding protein
MNYFKLSAVCRLGNDAVVNNVNGKSVINFNAACSDKYKNKEGVQMENTTWINCSYWTEQTGIAAFLKKGGQILIEGKPECKIYTDKNGVQQPQLTVRINYIQLLGGASTTQSNQQSQPQQQSQQAPLDEFPDDLPF